MKHSLGVRLLDFIGGYVELVFVPPFVGDWQQCMAERSLGQARRAAEAKLVADHRAVAKNLKNTRAQLDGLTERMREQERVLKSQLLTGSSPTEVEAKKNTMAIYYVNVQTLKKLREFAHMLARVEGQLFLRIHLLHATRGALSLGSAAGSVEGFRDAAAGLVSSEEEMDEVMRVLYKDEDDADAEWGRMVREFIRETADYRIDNRVFGPAKIFEEQGS